MDHVHLEDHVIVHEIGECALVGNNAAHLGCCKEDVLGLLCCEEGFYLILTGEVELFVGAGDDVGVALALELAHDGGTYHAAVSGYIDLTVFFHISS